MKTIYSMFILVIIKNLTTGEFSQTKSFIENILQDIIPHQITTFISKSLSNTYNHEISLVQKFPGNLLHLKDFDKSYNRSLINYNMDSSLIILFTNELNDTILLIDLLVKFIPLNPRPKSLVIFQDQNLNLSIEIESILKYAWKKKILDFTILKTNNDKKPSGIHCYNPFIDTFQEEFANQIFPNKFQNVKNYTLKVGFGKNFHKYLSGTPGDIFAKSRYQFIINFVIENMLFKFEFININPKDVNGFKYPRERYVWFDKTDANLLGDFVVITDGLRRLVVSHSGRKCRSVVAVFPRLYKIKLDILPQIFYLALFVTGIVLVLFKITKILKISSEFNGVFYVVRILMGQAVENLPSRTASRIIYMTIAIFFVILSNQFYTGIIDVNLIREEIEFESFEDVDQSQMLLFTSIENIDYIYFDSYAPSMKNLKKKTGRMKNCIEELNKTKNHICIEWKYDVDIYLKNYAADELTFMKVAKLPYFCDDMFFRFEYASPYMKRFSQVNQWIIESGIMQIEFFKNKLEWGNRINVAPPEEETKILNQLIIFLAVGYTVAVLVFFTERIIWYLKNTFLNFNSSAEFNFLQIFSK